VIRVVFGRLDGELPSLGLNGERVMILGGSLLVDGKRIARKRTWGGAGGERWVDELGRAWDTLEFRPVELLDEAG
jgi:hypothetical protein